MWQINDQLKILLPGEFSTVFLQSNPLSALNFFFFPSWDNTFFYLLLIASPSAVSFAGFSDLNSNL